MTDPLPPDEPRKYPSTIGGVFYLLILAAATAGIVVAVRANWRTGVQILGGALLTAAAARLLLRQRDAGMLAVRSRFLDVTVLTGLGVSLIVLSATIPDQPGA